MTSTLSVVLGYLDASFPWALVAPLPSSQEMFTVLCQDQKEAWTAQLGPPPPPPVRGRVTGCPRKEGSLSFLNSSFRGIISASDSWPSSDPLTPSLSLQAWGPGSS